MYKITINGFMLHDDTTDTTDDKVTAATLTKEENNAGTLSYTVPPNHQYYDGFGKPHIGNDVKVYENRRVSVGSDLDNNRWEDILIWEGRPISWSEDFAGNINVECEGGMARLNDIVYPGQESFNGTLYSAFSAVMDYYNARASNTIKYSAANLDDTKTVSMSLEEGTVLNVITSIVNSSESPLYLAYDLLFGELTLYVAGTTLDFLDGYKSQEITVDKNLLDLAKQIDYSEFATAIIPRDSDGNGVESVNDNSTVVIDTISHAVYGHIEKIVTFDEPAVQNNPSALLAAAKNWFKSANNTRGEIDVTALDLSVVQNYNPAYANDLYRPFALRQGIWFSGSDTAEPVQMVINRMELDLINPANSRYSLSVSDNPSVKPVSTFSLTSEDLPETFTESRAATDEASGYIGKKSDISYMLSKSDTVAVKTYNHETGINSSIASNSKIWLGGGDLVGNRGGDGWSALGWLQPNISPYPEFVCQKGVDADFISGYPADGSQANYMASNSFLNGHVLFFYKGFVSELISVSDLIASSGVTENIIGVQLYAPAVTFEGANIEVFPGVSQMVRQAAAYPTVYIVLEGPSRAPVPNFRVPMTEIATGLDYTYTTNRSIYFGDDDTSSAAIVIFSGNKLELAHKYRDEILNPNNKGYKIWTVPNGAPRYPTQKITDAHKRSCAGGYKALTQSSQIAYTDISFKYVLATGGIGLDIWDVPWAEVDNAYFKQNKWKTTIDMYGRLTVAT